MTFSQVFAVLMMVAAIFVFINERFLHFPFTIGLTVLSLGFSIILILCELVGIPFGHTIFLKLLTLIDFKTFLLEYALGFLLFAGAIHLSSRDLKPDRGLIVALASLGVIFSTLIYGVLLYLVLEGIFHIGLGWIDAFLFGAILAPTDPIAVISILRDMKLPKRLEVLVSGESLFNDGVSYTLFLILLSMKLHPDVVKAGDVLRIIGEEIFGGVLLGLVVGLLIVFLLARIREDITAIFVTVASVFFTISAATTLQVNGPLAVVIVGITIATRVHDIEIVCDPKSLLNIFWEMGDQILNGFLFMMIGFQVVFLTFFEQLWLESFFVIGIGILGRYLAVYLPVLIYRKRMQLSCNRWNLMRLLTWGGLKGGLTIALALQLPESALSNRIQALSYMVVIFSIVIQGSTIRKAVSIEDFELALKRNR